MPPHRRPANGPIPTPRWMPVPPLRYAHVGKSSRRLVVGGKHRMGGGPRLAMEPVLARCGWPITTALVERLDLAIRQQVAAIGRRVQTLCQGEAGWREQWGLYPV